MLPGDPEYAHSGLLPWTHPEESRRHQVLYIALIDFIARNLLPDKLVVGLVGIKGPHHVIPVTPRVGPGVVIGKSCRVRIAGHIQPMAPELLPVMGAGHKAAGVGPHRGLRIFSKLLLKLLNLARRRRQAGQSESHPPDQFSRTCHRGRFQTSLLQPAINKPVHGVYSLRDLLHLERAIGPEFLRFIPTIRPVFPQTARGLHDFPLCKAISQLPDAPGIQPWRSGIDPVPDLVLLLTG